MTSRDFAFWLQGLFELAEPETLNEKQTDLVKRHLNLVFEHEIDPSMSDDPEVQEKLQDIHDGTESKRRRQPRPPSGGRRDGRSGSSSDRRLMC